MMNIDLNGIKSAVISAYRTASAKVGEWSGRGVAVLKSGAEIALPYLQDKRIAVVSLIALNLILVEVGDLFSRLFTCCLRDQTEGQKAFGRIFKLSVGLGIVGSGVAAFSKYANIPLGWLAITVISAATILLRAALSTPIETRDVIKDEALKADEKADKPKVDDKADEPKEV